MPAALPPARISVDLSGYPDLVVINLGFRVASWRALGVLFGLGRPLNEMARNKPPGLLAHEMVLYGLRHIGMRQYWENLASLEAFTRSAPHKTWWAKFGGGAGAPMGIWHETYHMQGGMEAIYLNMPPSGFARFAPALAANGQAKTARARLNSVQPAH